MWVQGVKGSGDRSRRASIGGGVGLGTRSPGPYIRILTVGQGWKQILSASRAWPSSKGDQQEVD